jgi:hypothetical protein
MPKKSKRIRRAGVLIMVIAGVIAAMGYGIAQNTVVTQAEWAVYMVRALRLDWNLPADPKSHDYIARLNWQADIDVSATGVEAGSSPSLRVDSGFVQATAPGAEAIYRVSTIRTGDYGFRLKMAGGGAVVKIGDAVFDAYQPDESFQWVDLNWIGLDPGDHTVSVLLDEGTRAETLGVVPPCLVSVEPRDGWQPLAPLTFGDLAVTVARALELEYELEGIGPEMTIKGEEFNVLMEIPVANESEASEEPFWLSSGGSLVTARARFMAERSGLYVMQARYFSPSELRWSVDGCLRAITCPVEVSNAGLLWTNVVAVELEAGEHDLDIMLPPNASLDRVTIQQKNESIEEYLGVVSQEGFNMQAANELVSRRRAIGSALQLRNLFERWKNSRCEDTLIALEKIGMLLMAGGRRETETDPERIPGDRLISAGSSAGDDGRSPVFPTEPPVASPVTPESGS